MDGNHRFDPIVFRERPAQVLHRDVVSERVDVGEYHPRSKPLDAACRCEKGVGGGDDHINRPDPQRHQQDQLGVRARGNSDCVACASEGGYFRLDLFDLRPQCQVLRVGHLLDRSENLGLERGILAFQIEEGYTHV